MERIEGQKCDRPECMTQVGQTRQGPWSNKERPVVNLAEKIIRSSLGSFKVNYIAMLSWGVKTWGCCLVFFYSKTFHMKAANHCLPVVPFLGSIARFGSEMHIVRYLWLKLLSSCSPSRSFAAQGWSVYLSYLYTVLWLTSRSKMLMKLLHPTLVLLWTVCIRSCVVLWTSYSFHSKSSDKCKRTTIAHIIYQGRLKRKTCWNKLMIVCEIILFSCAFRQDRVRSILHFMTKVATSSISKHQSPISVARLAISGKECLLCYFRTDPSFETIDYIPVTKQWVNLVLTVIAVTNL